MTREYTNRIIDFIDEGLFGEVNEATETLIIGLLNWLSEDEVKHFYQVNGYTAWDGEEDED